LSPRRGSARPGGGGAGALLRVCGAAEPRGRGGSRRGVGSIPGLLILVLAAVGASAPPFAAAQAGAGELPRVHVIATGGTIASRGAVGPLSVEQLVEGVPGIQEIATLTVEQFANVGSSQITPAHWLALSRRITALFRERPELDGIVVTHGTDTLEETALFLHLTVDDPRPVVLTGAMRPPTVVAPEGPANLRAAVRLAASDGARERGTLVAMNDQIFGAGDVVKAHTSRLDAFSAPAGGPVGVVEGDEVRFHHIGDPQRLHVELGGVDALPRVDIAYAFGGADGTAVDAFVAAGARGIVLASVGRGNLPAELGSAARRAAEGGVVVLVSSRAGAGRVPVGTTPVEPGRPFLPGAGPLNPQRARVLLMLALAVGGEVEEVAGLVARMEGVPER
jgi:L-asparaginase